jgi:hypothetical protein
MILETRPKRIAFPVRVWTSSGFLATSRTISPPSPNEATVVKISRYDRRREYCPIPSTPNLLETTYTRARETNGFTALGIDSATVFLNRLFFDSRVILKLKEPT